MIHEDQPPRPSDRSEMLAFNRGLAACLDDPRTFGKPPEPPSAPPVQIVLQVDPDLPLGTAELRGANGSVVRIENIT